VFTVLTSSIFTVIITIFHGSFQACVLFATFTSNMLQHLRNSCPYNAVVTVLGQTRDAQYTARNQISWLIIFLYLFHTQMFVIRIAADFRSISTVCK
jgi:hypothetical protein